MIASMMSPFIDLAKTPLVPVTIGTNREEHLKTLIRWTTRNKPKRSRNECLWTGRVRTATIPRPQAVSPIQYLLLRSVLSLLLFHPIASLSSLSQRADRHGLTLRSHKHPSRSVATWLAELEFSSGSQRVCVLCMLGTCVWANERVGERRNERANKRESE